MFLWLFQCTELLEYELTGSDEEEIDGLKQAVPMTNGSKSNKQHVRSSDFEFLKVIGRGSFGKVMQVKKKDTGEILAMKILKKKAIIARNQIEHTKSERNILRQLEHPFLMRLRYRFNVQTLSRSDITSYVWSVHYSQDTHSPQRYIEELSNITHDSINHSLHIILFQEKLYFVLEYYEGGELFFHLKKRRRFSERESQIFVGETALALGHLHKLGVIYRDLKPENILLDREVMFNILLLLFLFDFH